MAVVPVQYPVVIVGGGFSGTMVAAQLARRGVASLIVEGGGRAGRGTAYATREDVHLLNVRAASMSAWPDRPEDFSAALRARGVAPDEAASGFAPRRRFGEYLRGILDQAMASGLVDLAEDVAVAAEPDGAGWRMRLESGREVAAAALVLATGNQPPEPLPGTPDGAADWLIDDPWSLAGQARVAAAAEAGGDLLVVGTGLSMVDMVLTLGAHGHRGNVTAVSRRGLVPRGHGAPGPAVVAAEEPPVGLMPLWRWVRAKAVREPWRDVVDSLRSHSHRLWQGLSAAEQRRFRRHARPWWDVHRHRIAPSVSATLAGQIGEGRLEVMAGRIRGFEVAGDGVEVRIGRRGGAETVRRVAAVINCTGPLGAAARTRDPLVGQLLDDRIVEPDRLGLGLAMAAGGDRVACGAPLWAPGALSKGSWWENVAVPDLKGQCERIAEALAVELREPNR